MQRIQQAFEQSPGKSAGRANRQLTIPHITVWHVLRRCLVYKPYQFQLVQALHVGDKRKHVEFCNDLLIDMEDDRVLPQLIFSDEAMFHVSSKVNRHNVRI